MNVHLKFIKTELKKQSPYECLRILLQIRFKNINTVI